MKQNSKIISLLLIFAVSVIAPLITQAQATPCPSPPYQGSGTCPPGQCKTGASQGRDICEIANPAPGQLVNIKNFGDLLLRFINWLLYFAGAVAVIFLVIGGYQYVASHGNEEAAEKAKKTLTYAILGIIIIVLAFAIVAIVNTLLTTSPPG